MTGILVLGHGSRSQEANESLVTICDMIKEQGEFTLVQPAYMEHCDPNLKQGVESLLEKGAKKILLMPFFLYRGIHLKEDIPNELAEIKEEYPDLEIVMTPHLGIDKRLAEIAVERIKEVG